MKTDCVILLNISVPDFLGGRGELIGTDLMDLPITFKYSLRYRKCGVRGFIHELFVSKTRTSRVRASEGF